MIFDSHMHTQFSADSEMQAAEAVLAAEKLGLGMVFTEHLDLDYPGDLAFSFSPEEYWEAYGSLRSTKLRLGAELGMQAGQGERNKAFAARVPFDMIIGSIHVVEQADIYYKTFYEGRSKRETYEAYFAAMAECLKEHAFVDVLGHMDYIARYAPYENAELQYQAYNEAIDQVLEAAVATDTVLELNTRRLGDRLALKELTPIYRRYYALGGRYVTLGSDAHEAKAIGTAFAAAADFAEACRLEVVTFCGRQMEYCTE